MRKDKRKLKTRKADPYSAYYERKAWTELRRLVNKGKCEMCGSAEKVQVHHILSKEIYPHFTYELDNCIALCGGGCHKFGKKSAHKNGFYFVMWLFRNFATKFHWCEKNRNHFKEEGFKLNHKENWELLQEIK